MELPSATCSNCRAALTGRYCADCGQHVADSHRSVWRFVADFFDNTFCWDNKLLRTLQPLFQRPGYLTREFMAGRRVRYVHPLRLFLFTSAVCLTLLQLSRDHLAESAIVGVVLGGNVRDFQWIAPDPSGAADTLATVANAPVSLASEHDEMAQRENGNLPPGRVASDTHSNGLEAQFEQALETRIVRNGGVASLNKAISDSVQRRLSWIVLALLPVFALALRALYWRKDAFYFAHLVFSLHYHTFLLIFWTAYVGMGIVALHVPLAWLAGLALRSSLLLPPLYLFVALRRRYGESRVRTLAKMLALVSMHLLLGLVSLIVVGGMIYALL